jgi:hypothetical protein
MNQFKWAASVMLASLLAAGAYAQDDRPAGPPDEGGPSPELNLEVIEQFDANSDGELNGDEVGRARRFLQALRGLVGDRGDRPRGEGRCDRPRADRPDEPGPKGPPEEGVEGDRPPGDRPRGDRGLRGDWRRPRADGEGPPAERPRGPRDEPRRMFKEFDADGNGELNPEEFAALMGALDQRRGPRGPGAGPDGPPEGPRFGPGGPPDGRPFRRRGPPDGGEGGPEFRGPGGPPPGAEDGDREGPRRFRPRDGERGRRPAPPDGGDAPPWDGDEPVGDEPDAGA